MKSFVHKRPREKFGKMAVGPYIWRGLDGSEVTALRMNNKGNGLPSLSEGYQAPKGKGDLAVIAEAAAALSLDHLFGPMGIGDIGGVNSYKLPTASDIFKFHYSTAEKFFTMVDSQVDRNILPVMSGSMQPETMGAMTTWANVKSLNRQAEIALQTTEYLIVMARILGISSEAGDIAAAWKRVMLCQFHDSLCGCGTEDIQPVIEHDYRQSIVEANTNASMLMRQIAESIDIDMAAGLPVTVFNPLGRCRSDMVSARVTLPKDYLGLVPLGRPDTLTHKIDCRDFIPADELELEAVDDNGNTVPVMITNYAQVQKKFVVDIRFKANNVPAFGYCTFQLRKRNNSKPLVAVEGNTISTDKLTVSFDTKLGGISRLAVKSFNKEKNQVIEGLPANPLGQLAIHHTGDYVLDYGQEMRAWYPGFTGEVDILRPVAGEIRRYSGHRVGVIFHYSFGKSTFSQEFMIEPDMNSIDVLLKGDWQEVEKYLKVHFALNGTKGQSAFADLPYGFTERLPEGEEYAMQYMAGIRNMRSGLTVLNDSRYGCMWKNCSLSLSAIRCATYPAHISDSGEFEMQYRVVPLDTTSDGWEGRIVQVGFEYNLALRSYAQEFTSRQRPGRMAMLPNSKSEILATCMKLSEIGDALVLRLYNPTNRAVTQIFTIPAGFTTATMSNLLEEPIDGAETTSASIELQFRPYEITTLLLK